MNIQLFLNRAAGKLRRNLVRVPDQPLVTEIRGVRFEHKNLPFLSPEDFRAMLSQSYDIILCDYLRKRLSSGDIVLDVGANVGYITAIIAGFVGTTGEVHSFEPLDECFERLDRVRQLNPQFRLKLNQAAVGAEKGSLSISYNPDGDIRNATLVPGKHGKDHPKTREVPVLRLDDYIAENIPNPERIKVIKIDVEGFEFSVLQGLERFFASSARPEIVCEIKPWEIRNLGFTMEDFDQLMKRFDYRAYDMIDNRKPVELVSLDDMETLLFRAR